MQINYQDMMREVFVWQLIMINMAILHPAHPTTALDLQQAAGL